MTGLEKIMGIIRQEAQNDADAIISKATQEANGIIAEAKAKADSVKAEIGAAGQAKTQDILERGKSAAELENRKTLLSTKQSIIKNVIEEAKVKLNSLTDDDYFAFLLKLLEKYKTDDKANMKLSSKDLKRLPNDFAEKISKIGDITLSNEPATIKNGFLLIYGGIDINCSFDALFDDALEDLQDTAGKILF